MLTTTAGAASETKFNAVKSSTAANPFARLRPQLRSEEDEIRKGIFGRALRLLHTATAEEKQQWCGAIREATAAQQSSIRKRAEQKNNDNNNNNNNNNNNININSINRSNNDDVTVDSLFAPMKRPREEDGEEMMAKMGVKVEGEIAEENKMTEGEQCEKQGPADASNTGDSAGPAAAAEPQPTDTEFIAAYLRTLLDKVIGLSLMELHVSALQVLCVMLGVDLPKSKSKMSLYSNLASFHYTHCEKLGKRVSSSHNLEEQLKRDEQMIKKIFTKPTSAGKNKTVETTPTTTKLSAAAAAGTLRTNNATVNNTPANKDEKKSSHKKDEQRAVASATEKNISPLVDSAPRIGNYRPVTDAAVKVQKTKTSIRKEDKQKEEEKKFKPTRTEQELGLEIQYHSRVFADATASHQAAPSARNEDGDSDGDNYEDEEEAEEWSRPSLERKVASVVQLCDPVTAAMVVKKLAQMGYNEPGAMETVEMILRSFHQRELVFYDNGIAYLL